MLTDEVKGGWRRIEKTGEMKKVGIDRVGRTTAGEARGSGGNWHRGVAIED